MELLEKYKFLLIGVIILGVALTTGYYVRKYTNLQQEAEQFKIKIKTLSELNDQNEKEIKRLKVDLENASKIKTALQEKKELTIQKVKEVNAKIDAVKNKPNQEYEKSINEIYKEATRCALGC